MHFLWREVSGEEGREGRGTHAFVDVVERDLNVGRDAAEREDNRYEWPLDSRNSVAASAGKGETRTMK